MENGKDEDINEGVIIKDGSSGDRWLGIGMAVVTGRGGEKGSGEAINNSVSMVRCSPGAFCWDASEYCTSSLASPPGIGRYPHPSWRLAPGPKGNL